MTASAKTGRGPGVKPAVKKRTVPFNMRLSPIEKAAMEANAAEAGVDLSEYVRQRCCTVVGAPKPAATRSQPESPAARARGDFEVRVQKLAKTMPRQNAETVVRRELAREGGRG